MWLDLVLGVGASAMMLAVVEHDLEQPLSSAGTVGQVVVRELREVWLRDCRT